MLASRGSGWAHVYGHSFVPAPVVNVTSSVINATLSSINESGLEPSAGLQYPCEHALISNYLRWFRRSWMQRLHERAGELSETDQVYFAAFVAKQLSLLDSEFTEA